MPALYHAYDLALLLTAAMGVAFALLLWRKARAAAGVLPLTSFVLGSALGTLGWVSLSLFGTSVALPAHLAIATAPVTAACFLHFAFAFTRSQSGKPLEPAVLAAYALGALITLGAWIRGVGSIKPWLAFEAYYHLDWYGWVIVGATALLAALGHLRLFLAWWSAAPMRRRQLVAVCIAALWGFAASLGFLFPNFGIDLFPAPVLLLPLYLVILVYGVLRYQVMDVNLWARRTVTWLLLMLLSGLGLGGAVALTAASGKVIGLDISFGRAWILGSAAVLLAAILLTPLRRLADRLVFPGGRLSDEDLARWRIALARPSDWRALAAEAERLIRDHLRAEIAIRIPDRFAIAAGPTASGPALECRQRNGEWHCAMTGWDDAPPGPRYVGQLFGGVLADAAMRLELAEEAAAREGERRQQAYLAELGALSATVAHDLRNPLNIIAMAVADGSAELRAEIGAQLGRMNHLISDLLDYSSAWKVERRRLLLRDEIESAVVGFPGTAIEIAVDPNLVVEGDTRRLRRVFSNLISNARAAAPLDGRIRIEARREADAIIVELCDQGSGIPPDIRDKLFQPFVSRSADGTGLGLAIVARIMEAHGGGVALAERPGWSTCVSLRFPMPRQVQP